MRDSLLYREFGVEITGDTFGDGISTKEPTAVDVYQNDRDKELLGEIIGDKASIRRFRAVTSRSSDYIPILRQADDESFPLALIGYGNGFLIHAGMFLESENSLEFQLLLRVVEAFIHNRCKILRP